MIALIIVIVVVVALALLGASAFNRLRKADIGAQEALGGIDVQLTRRADLIPNLISTVKGYAAHEAGVFESVTAARSRVADAAKGNDVPEKARADAQLSQSLVNVMAVAEAYPELKASTNFADLHKQLADTENQISFARQYYNDSVTKLNGAVTTIPTLFFAGVAGVTKREFYRAPDGADAVPSVDFGASAPAVPPAVSPPVSPAVPPSGAPPAVDPPASPPAG